ncbi:MAG: HEAT repeat domain-containing protein [Clostridium sp.]
MELLKWNNIDNLSTEEISYLLFLEGKDVGTIAGIRGLSRNHIEKHIIHSKIKYKIYKKGRDERNILNLLMDCPKDERVLIISKINKEEITRLESYIINNIFKANQKECAFYIWFLGEIKSPRGIDRIITFLKCSDAAIKRMCCSAIGKIGSIKAEDALISTLDEKRSQVKEYAIKALGNINSKKAIPYLILIKDSKDKEYVRIAAVKALEKIDSGVSYE